MTTLRDFVGGTSGQLYVRATPDLPKLLGWEAAARDVAAAMEGATVKRNSTDQVIVRVTVPEDVLRRFVEDRPKAK